MEIKLRSSYVPDVFGLMFRTNYRDMVVCLNNSPPYGNGDSFSVTKSNATPGIRQLAECAGHKIEVQDDS